MTDPVIAVEGLSVEFRKRAALPFLRPPETIRALDNLSLSVRKGESFAVVGESGSGKTTLLRALLGLIPTSGSVRLWGVDWSERDEAGRREARRRIGYVFQDPQASLPPTLTVLKAVTEPWDLVYPDRRPEGAERARALLSELRLPEPLWGARVKHAVSGGQRQRVALARALVLEPELLLCDEPTAMQDISTRGEVLDVLLRRVREGMTMILVTHDLLLARRAAGRAVVLRHGVSVETGDTAALLQNPVHPYTRALIDALPRMRT
ncbi:MAG: ABC transporter ATP-binding protein [Fretibacterium sp.]|nr:ABC transporter ATP-binding protein [Fretibacterium sp.]